jgi:putative transposase
VSPQARREQIALACQRGLSKRRACGLLHVARSSLSYEPRLPAKAAPVIEAMKTTLSAQYPRYGATATGASGSSFDAKASS